MFAESQGSEKLIALMTATMMSIEGRDGIGDRHEGEHQGDQEAERKSHGRLRTEPDRLVPRLPHQCLAHMVAGSGIQPAATMSLAAESLVTKRWLETLRLKARDAL